MKKSFNKYFGKTRCTFGNKKMSFTTFNLPTGVTCPGKTKLCMQFCYAKKSERIYRNVKQHRHENLALSKTDKFVDVIAGELYKHGSDMVRIHESGDFYCQEYLNRWYTIAELYPFKQFLAFTKSFHLDFSKKPKNMVIYNSIWPDTGFIPANGLKCAYTLVNRNKMQRIKYDKFNDTMDSLPDVISCKGFCDDCKVCFFGNYEVKFNLH